MPTNLLTLPVTDDLKTEWRQRIEGATALNRLYHTEWEGNISRFEGNPVAGDGPDAVNVNKDFSTVRLKTAQLFFRTGDIQATALEPMKGREKAIALAQAILNSKLGRHEINAKAMTRRVLTFLETVGIGPSKIGYESFSRPVEMPVVDPATVPPEAVNQIPTRVVDQSIAERWFWSSFSPKDLLIPEEFEGNDFDQAAWLGMKYRLDTPVARRIFNLPEDFKGSGASKESRLSSEKSKSANDTRTECTEIWYYASRFDPSEPNPFVMRVLTFIEGLEDPIVEHRPSPHQTVLPNGSLSKDSLIGNPIHPLAVNYVPDRAYPPSDCSMIRPQVVELCKFRSQMQRQRDASVPARWFDRQRIDPAVAAKLEEGTYQGWIGIDGPADNQLGEIARANYPRENFTAQNVIEHDLDQTLAIGSAQRGAVSDTERTATEIQTMNGGMEVRLDDERNAVVDWYVRGVMKLWSLIQRYATNEDYVEILGPQGATEIVAWTNQDIKGRFQFDLKPDSTIRIDSAADKKQALDEYNLFAKDPLVNRAELLQNCFRRLNQEPSRMMAQPQAKKPDPLNVSFRFGRDDLNPLNPSFPIVVSLIEQGGYSIPPELVKAAQAKAGNQIMSSVGMATPTPAGVPPVRPPAPMNREHGGMADKADVLDKHSLDRTGGLPGVGRI